MSFLSRLGGFITGAAAGSMIAPGVGTLIGGVAGLFGKELSDIGSKVFGNKAGGRGAVIGGFAGAVLGSFMGMPMVGGALGALLGGLIGRSCGGQSAQHQCCHQCGHHHMNSYGSANGFNAGAYGFPNAGCFPQPMPWYPGGNNMPMPMPMPNCGFPSFPSTGYPQMPYAPNWGMPPNYFPWDGGASHGTHHHHHYGPYQNFHQIPPFPGEGQCWCNYPGHDRERYVECHSKPVRQHGGSRQTHEGSWKADDVRQVVTRFGRSTTQRAETHEGADKITQRRWGTGHSYQRADGGDGSDKIVQTRGGHGSSTQSSSGDHGNDITTQRRYGSGNSYQYASGGDGNNETSQYRSGSGSSTQSARGGEDYDVINQNRDGSGRTTQYARDAGGGATINQDGGRSGDTRQTAIAEDGATIKQTGSRYGSTTQTARTGDSPSNITQKAGQGFLGWGWGDKDTTHNVEMGNASDRYTGIGNSESNTFNVKLSDGADVYNIDGKGGKDTINVDVNGEPVWIKDSAGRTIYKSDNWTTGGSVMNTTGVETISVKDGDCTTDYTQSRTRRGRGRGGRWVTSWVGTPQN